MLNQMSLKDRKSRKRYYCTYNSILNEINYTVMESRSYLSYL